MRALSAADQVRSVDAGTANSGEVAALDVEGAPARLAFAPCAAKTCDLLASDLASARAGEGRTVALSASRLSAGDSACREDGRR